MLTNPVFQKWGIGYYKLIYVFLFFLMLPAFAAAGPTLNSGDLVVVARNAGNMDDQFALVALADIPGSSVIFLTDEGWDDNDFTFDGGEDVFKWTVHADGIDAGTIIRFTNESTTTLEIEDSDHGTVSSVNGSSDMELSAGDQLFIYQTDNDSNNGTIQRLDGAGGTESGMIYAFNGDNSTPNTYGWLDAGYDHTSAASQIPDNMTALSTSDGSGNANVANGNGMLTQAALKDSSADEYDNYKYDGPSTSAGKSDWLVRIHTTANWLASDTDTLSLNSSTLASNWTVGYTPTIVTNNSLVLNEGATKAIPLDSLEADDEDTDNSTLAFTITSSPSNGQVENTDNSGVSITGFFQQNLIDEKIQYVHDGSNTTSDSFTFKVGDGTHELTGQTYSITVNAMDDDTPTISTNNGLNLDEGATQAIPLDSLEADDSDTDNATLTYTITTSPANGQVENTDNAGVSITSFFQQNLTDEKIQYVHDGSNTTSDSFTFKVADGTPNELTAQTFIFSVTAVDDDTPTLSTNNGLTLNEGDTAGITLALLEADDTDTDNSTLTYTITTSTFYGQVENSDNSGSLITSFTQQNLSDGKIQYVHDGGSTSSDSFTFKVADGNSNELTGQTFNITVTSNDVDTIAGYAADNDASELTIEQLEAIGITDLDSYKLQEYIDAVEAADQDDADSVADIQDIIDQVNSEIAESETDAGIATLINAPEGRINTVTHEVTVRGIGIESYSYKIDDGDWSSEILISETINFTADTEGQYTLYVIGKDEADQWQGEEDATTASWILDLTPPEVDSLTRLPGTDGVLSATVRVAGDDVQYYRYRNCSSDCDWSVVFAVNAPINLTNLTEGTQTLAVIGCDIAGNWQDEDSQAELSWDIDTSLPVAVVLDGPDSVTNETEATLTIGSQTEEMPVDDYKYSLDAGVTWVSQSSDEPISLTSLADGQYSVYLNGYNEANDRWQDDSNGETISGASLHQWTVKTTPPDAVTLTVSAGIPASSSVVMNWDAPEDGLKRYLLYYADTSEALETLENAYSLPNTINPGPEGHTETFEIEGLSPGTTYYFGLISEDAAGNLSALSNSAELETLSNQPEISDFYLDGGAQAGDNSQSRELTIEGDNFIETSGNNIVWFLGSAGGFQVAGKSGTEQKILVDVPQGAPSGEYALKIVNKNGTSPVSSETYTISSSESPLPEVVYVSPATGRSDSDTTITIYGSNLSDPLSVDLVSFDGSEFINLVDVVSEDDETLEATVPADSPVNSYAISIANTNGTSDTGLAGFEIFTPIDLEDLSTPVETTMGVLLPSDATVPVDIKLSSDDRDEVYGSAIANTRIEVAINAGTEFESLDETEGWNDYSGLISPPRPIPIPPEASGYLGDNPVAFSMGAENQLRLKNDQTMVVSISLSMETDKGTPKIYYIPEDGPPELAGVDGEHDGVTYSPGGVLLGTAREDVPQEGYTTYTFGLLLDHMSVYAAGFLSEDSGGGGCFKSTAACNTNPYPVVIGMVCIVLIGFIEIGRRYWKRRF